MGIQHMPVYRTDKYKFENPGKNSIAVKPKPCFIVQ